MFADFVVYVHTHKQTWIRGVARRCAENAPTLSVTFDELIEHGTSGGPVINEVGELVGIISSVLVEASFLPVCTGMIPRPHLTLPVWILRTITGLEERWRNRRRKAGGKMERPSRS